MLLWQSVPISSFQKKKNNPKNHYHHQQQQKQQTQNQKTKRGNQKTDILFQTNCVGT